ncbi:Usp7, partial [Symbiodinium microadriaticum]
AQKISERLMSKVVSESEVVARKGQVGLVEYRRECTERVGAITVWKKSGRQRLVIDCRAANLHFEQPERVHLATVSAFARLAVDSGERVEVGGVDIADAFYNIQLLPELRGYFGLGPHMWTNGPFCTHKYVDNFVALSQRTCQYPGAQESMPPMLLTGAEALSLTIVKLQIFVSLEGCEGEGETDGSFGVTKPRAEDETPVFSGEVPLDFIGTGWQKVDSAPWSRDEPIPVLEGRVLVWLGQQLAALEFATGAQLVPRWVPSEVNPADPPSRARSVESFDLAAGVCKILEEDAAQAKSGVVETPAEKKPKEQNSLSSVQRRKEHRATLRRRMHGEGLVQDASSTKTFLERQSVTAARERSYALAWDSLVSWAKSNRRDMSSVTALDAAVTVRLNEMFFDGHDLADGTTLLAAVKFFRQDAKEQRLTRASDALRYVGSEKMKESARASEDLNWTFMVAVSEVNQMLTDCRLAAQTSADIGHRLGTEGRVGRGMARQSDRCASAKERRTAVSPFRSLPELHPHEVELRVSVKDLSRDVAPEKFRSKAKSVGGFVFGLLVFPQGTKSAPEHARKNRPGKGKEEDLDTDKAKARRRDTQKTEKEKLKAALLKEVPKEKERDKENEKDGNKDGDGKEDKKDTRWISAFVEARPSEDYPPHWYFEDVQFLVSLINFQDLKKSIVKHDKHTFSPVESSDGKAIDRGWHDFVHCDEATLRNSGFVDKDDTVCFRASVYLAGGAMKVNSKTKSRYMSLSKIDPGSYERAPQFLNSLVQIWYHLGYFRSARRPGILSSDVEQRLASPRTAEAIYSASNPCQLSGAKKSRAGGPRKKRKLDSDATRTGTRTRLFWAEVLPALREIFVRLQDSRNLWKSLLLVLPFGIPCSAQHRTLPASCSVLCAAFGRKGWQKICKAWACLGPGVALQRERERARPPWRKKELVQADPDVFCSEVFQCLESELMPSQEMLKAEP